MCCRHPSRRIAEPVIGRAFARPVGDAPQDEVCWVARPGAMNVNHTTPLNHSHAHDTQSMSGTSVTDTRLPHIKSRGNEPLFQTGALPMRRISTLCAAAGLALTALAA